MSEIKTRVPAPEEAKYQKLLEQHTEDNFAFIHGRINYDQIMASYSRMIKAFEAIPAGTVPKEGGQ